MLERLNYNNFKNLAINATNQASSLIRSAAIGTIAGSTISVLYPCSKPLGCNLLPDWVINHLPKTHHFAVTYLKENLDTSYIVAPVLKQAIAPLAKCICSVDPDSDADSDMRYLNALFITYVVTYAIQVRIGYNMNLVEHFFKGFVLPAFTKHAMQELLDVALPKPKDTEASAI